MKLADHVDHIRKLIYGAFNNQFSRLGVGPSKMMDVDKIPSQLRNKHDKIAVLIQNHTDEKGNYAEAREKALDELTFTLFNRLAAIKVMEAHQLFPPIITKEAQHGDRSFGHKAWLEQYPEMRDEELEGLRDYLKYEFNQLGESIPLYHKDYPYALLPFVIELNEIIDAFNVVVQDAQVEAAIWQSDDILGWLYESYNNAKKQAHKDSGDKTEYHKVSLQSQVYTPRWVVEFLVNNSLGKLYLEMYPDSEIKNNYKIANAPKEQLREIKPLHEIKLIDPASGSGNFLLYAFSLFYALYLDQIENYFADYDEDSVPQLIIENNLYGIDLDDRAVQLGQLGLWIKAKQKHRSIGKLNFNVVSSDFFLPEFEFVYPAFEAGISDKNQLNIVRDIWEDLRQAHKFGSLVKIEEKLSIRLHGIIDQASSTIFGQQELDEYEKFKNDFFKNLEDAVTRFSSQQGNSFLADKTHDAITFLKLITQKYDIATANPPYTDSADFGAELKAFIENNYKKSYKFNTNLYATFIKRSFELLNDDGFYASISPMTFMFIKTFEDVRKFILSNSKIEVLAELGLGGVFLSHYVVVYAASFILKKTKRVTGNSLFLNFQAYHGKLNKKELFTSAFNNYIEKIPDKHNYKLQQSKLKIIKSWPFIYWISDEFREKFKQQTIEDIGAAKPGLQTGSNERFLRFWWEIDKNDISEKIDDSKKWKGYAKGGSYQKWAGNLWLVIDWEASGQKLNNFKKSILRNHKFYFKEGVTYSASGSKGASFRYLPTNNIFDVGGASVFLEDSNSTKYALALLNSKFSKYVINCLNPTVNTQKGDIDRIPYFKPNSINGEIVRLSEINVNITNEIIKKSIIEKDFISPLKIGPNPTNIKIWLNKENHLLSQVLLNEAIVDDKIFEISDITKEDIEIINKNLGISIGALPLCVSAKQEFLENEVKEFPLNNIIEYVHSLPIKKFTTDEREIIESDFPQLYQSNSDLEEFCIRHQVNPINVWFWFKQSNVIPKQRMNDLAMEFLADLLCEILMEDDDGIIPLVPNAGEKVLLDRIEEKFIDKGYSMAQYSSFDSILGRELNDYINNYFFNEFSNHLNVFRHLPATPFVWHLTSGPEQGFDCYIIIYKWNKDRLLRLRSVYIENRERALINHQTDLRKKELLSAAEQTEVDKIYKQLKEIEAFKQKIDELLEEGYDPILDDGVGKNIAPLQKKGMLAYDVLNAGQLKKYLNKDW